MSKLLFTAQTKLFLLLLVCSLHPVLTQAEVFPGFHVGYINSSASIKPDGSVSGTSGISGIGLGVFLRMQNDIFSVQPELNWIPKGYSVTSSSGDIELSASYIEVPLLFKVQVIDLFVPLHFLFGPNLGFKIGDSCEISSDSSASTAACTSNTIGFSTFNVSIDIGVGADFAVFSNVTLLLDVRYSLGISDIYSAANNSAANLDINLKALEFFFGVQWPWG